MAAHLVLRVLRHRRAGLVHAPAVHKDQPRHDMGLRLLAAVQQTAIHQRHVQPDPSAHASTSLTAAAMPAASSPSP